MSNICPSCHENRLTDKRRSFFIFFGIIACPASTVGALVAICNKAFFLAGIFLGIMIVGYAAVLAGHFLKPKGVQVCMSCGHNTGPI